MKNKSAQDGKFILKLLLGFFGLIFTVNGIFLYFAFSSHPGVETEEAYEKGRLYNVTLENEAQAKKLGWQFSLGHTTRENGATEFLITITDKNGLPVSGLDLSARVVRPVTAGHDLSVDFMRVGDGQHQALVALPFKGLWEVRVLGTNNQGDKIQFIERVVLPG